ncbi:hypothetical protein BDC45DRAFT_1805 [Circinella umbellata]|nr:hypothetical protein BDC45DRAFT_1805 [Circinella umbellata]
MTYKGYGDDNNALKPYSSQAVMISNSSSTSINGANIPSSTTSTPIITSVNSTITATPLSTATSTPLPSATTSVTIINRGHTDAYLLFCADHRENNNDMSLDQQWNELSQSHKKKYHQRAIIINSKLLEEEENEEEEDDYNKNKDKRFIPDKIITAAGKRTAMEHLVSPDAIRQAEREEKEELLGSNAKHHPFSAYPSILSMKKHDRRNSSASNSISPPPTFSPGQPYHYDLLEDSPSPSSSATISSSTGNREDSLIISSLDDTNTTNVTNMFNNHTYLDNTNDMQQQHHQQPAPIKERLKRPPNAYLLFNRDIRRRLLEESPKMTVAEISKEIGERWKRLDPESRQKYMQQAALIKQDHLKNHPDFIYTRRSKAQLAEARKFSRSRKGSNNPTNNTITHNNMFSSATATTSVSNTMVASTSIPTTAGWPAAEGVTTPTNYTTVNHTLVPHKRRRKSGIHDVPRDPRGRKKKRHRHPTAPKHPMSGFLFFLAAVRPEVARQYPGSTVGPISKVIASQWRDMTDEDRIPWLQMAEEDKARYAREMRVYTASLEREVGDTTLSPSEATTSDDSFVAGIVQM